MTVKISACLVVRNEERVIRKCLESIKDVVDEMIVVDDYSTDKTVEICKRYTEKVYLNDSGGYIEPNRTFALEKATGGWILVVDADEELSKSLQMDLRTFTQQNEYVAYSFARRDYYDENGKKWTKYANYPGYQLRFYKKEKVICYPGGIHDSPQIAGKVKNLPDIYYLIHHVPNHYSFSKFRNHHLRFARIQAEQTERIKPKVFYYAKAFSAFFYYFIEMFLIKKWLLDGIVGLKASLMMASYFFMVNYYIAAGD